MFHLLLAIIYISFISLGLPDGLLGAAWPTMYPEMGAELSGSGVVFLIISAGTVVSSLMCDRLTHRLGTGKINALSVAATAIALVGFSRSTAFWQLCLWAIPYGLGAGSVDACLNNYVALHYSSRHMSWLHCMWGIGAAVGPYIMGAILSGGGHWSGGYFAVGVVELILTAVLFVTLPLWKRTGQTAQEAAAGTKPLKLREVLAIPGAWEIMATFFCYCALEQTAGLWACSYLVLEKGVEATTAASFAGIFFIGITAGRAFNGFLTVKFTDTQLIRAGSGIMLLGIAALLLPLGSAMSLVGLILIGLGCAPVYPCIIHSTPANFGPEQSQALIGVQMASAYVGICLMPPLFGLVAEHISAALLPAYLLALLALMVFMYERVLKKVR